MFSLTSRDLDDGHRILVGFLPAWLLPGDREFNALWDLHPERFHKIRMMGRLVPTPRWQQAYGMDYQYAGRTNAALPIPERLRPFLGAVQEAIDPRLNGLLLNWYDGLRRHYIGRHRDSRTGMVPGVPIVTISLGDRRVFRLRPWKGRGVCDFEVANGTVIVMPYDTNLTWTHEVPCRAQDRGRRISLTLRAFQEEWSKQEPSG